MIISRLIDKNFSEYEDEKLYSVLMDEDELRLYSEFLEERQFGKWDNLGKRIAKLPEVQKMVKHAEMATKRGAVRYGQGIKGITGDIMKYYEEATPEVGKLAKRAAKAVGKASNVVAAEAKNSRQALGKLKTSEVLGNLYRR